MAFSAILVILCAIYFKRRHSLPPPPTHKGWLPVLGCAIEFGKSPLSFIGKKRQELGPLFSLYLAGDTLTFLFDSKEYRIFFESENVDFLKTVQEPVERAASIGNASVQKRLWHLHKTVKGKMAPGNIQSLTPSLCQQFDSLFQKYIHPGEEFSLFYVLKRCMYAPILHTLYRDQGFNVDIEEEYERFIQQFEIYDDDFELGVKLPAVFVPRWKKAKEFMLKAMMGACRMENTQDTLTLLDALKSAIDSDEAPNYTVLVMMASLANVVPVAFWTLARIFTDPRVETKLRKELEEVLHDKIAVGDYEITGEDIKNLPYLKCCVQEALRLSSEGIIARKVVKDFDLMGYRVKKGQTMLLSPYWAHRDPEVYPDPNTFRPERWEGVSIEKLSYKQGFLVFGGGRWQCPGRHFGYLIMQTFVASFMLRYKCTVHNPVPPACMKHLIGVQHPEGPFQVTCSLQSYADS